MKILFKIKDNSLQILNRKKLNSDYKNMLNTNVINNNELVFSDEYIKSNYRIMVSFLNGLIDEYHINKLVFQNNDVANLFMPFMPSIENIEYLYIESDEIFLYQYYEYLKKNKNMKYVSARFIPEYLFELLDKIGIIPESRDEILFTSNFMELNKLNNYASIYYKFIINLEFPMSKEDLDDFNTFCKINKNLKVININLPDRHNLESVISILKEYNKRNVTIIINSDITDLNLIEYLQKNNKLLKRNNKITFKLKYSNYYIQENLANEANNRILSASAFLIVFLILFSVAYVVYDNYSSMHEIAKVNNELIEYIQGFDPTDIPDYVIEEDQQYKINNDYIFALKEINSDVVGWLTVKNTNIDYAVVQTTDNDYYLSHNIYKEKSAPGWVFMDYENNPVNFDDNTIIYAHNRYTSGVMFGTLSYTLSKKWYTDPENQIISFDTAYANNKFRIFSIYISANTTDYLVTKFYEKENKIKYIDKIKKRSIYNFGVNVTPDDRLITLSTCYGQDRLVVHGVLINE